MFTKSLEDGRRFKLHRLALGSGAPVYALKDLEGDRAIIIKGAAVPRLEMVVSSYAGSPEPFTADDVLARLWSQVESEAIKAG